MANASHANGLQDELGHAAADAAAAAAAAKCSPGCNYVSGDGGSGYPPSGVRDHQHEHGHEQKQQQQQQQEQQVVFYGGTHRRQPGYTGGQGWERRVLVGTAVGATAGAIGGIARNAFMPMASSVAVAANAAAVVASSRRSRPLHSVASIALNATIVAASLAGCTEVVRELRSGWADETVNGLLGGGIAGYALGTLHGGRPLGPPTALVGMAAGVVLHAMVRQVEVWRWHLIHGDLHGTRSTSAATNPTDHSQRSEEAGGAGSASLSWMEQLLDRVFGTAAPSTSSLAPLDHRTAPTPSEGQLCVGQTRAEAEAEAEAEEKEWPKWLPIRKLTKKELKEREEKLARMKLAKAALDAQNQKP